MSRKIGRGFFNVREKLAEIKQQQLKQQEQVTEQIEEFNFINKDHSIRKSDLIIKGKEYLNNESEAFGNFFEEMQPGELNKFSVNTQTRDKFTSLFEKINRNFEYKLKKVQNQEASNSILTIDAETKNKVNKRFTEIKKNKKRSQQQPKIHYGGTNEYEADANEIINFDKIKKEHQEKVLKPLPEWQKFQLYNDIIAEEQRRYYDQLDDDDHELHQALCEFGNYTIPNEKQFYHSAKNLIVYIPSGGGKTTLYNRFKKFFFDIDQLLWFEDIYEKFHYIANYAFDTKEYFYTNYFWQELLARNHKAFKDRILLAHSPDQIPPGLRKQCDELILLPDRTYDLRHFRLNYEHLRSLKDIYKIETERENFFYVIMNYAYQLNRLKHFTDEFVHDLEYYDQHSIGYNDNFNHYDEAYDSKDDNLDNFEYIDSDLEIEELDYEAIKNIEE